MEEDVKPEDEDGVDGWGISGWDPWVCGLGAVSASLSFGLVRGDGTFTASSPLGCALAHHARVMDGCVVWVWWTSPWYLG
jgi:hypothetical protein